MALETKEMEPPLEREKEIYEYLFDPHLLKSFHEPLPQARTLQIAYSSSPANPEPEILTIGPFFPFFTLDDLKMAIYNAKGQDPAFAPENQFLGVYTSDQERNKMYPVYFYFAKGVTKRLALDAPFKAATSAQWDPTFVDSEGNRKLLEGTNDGRSTFENVLRKYYGEALPTFQLFILRDVLNAIPYPKPLSEAQFNGRVLSYFPSTTPESDGVTISATRKREIDALNTYFLSKLEILAGTLEPLLEDEVNFTTLPQVKDIKKISFFYPKKGQQSSIDLGSTFYELPVNSARPFLRFFPVDNVPVSKVHVKGALPIPDLPDSCILLDWAKQKSLTTERDFLMAKIKIQQDFGTIPLYATLFATDDGTAVLNIEPPKPLKKLDVQADLGNLEASVKEGIEGFPFNAERVNINEAHLVAKIRLEAGKPKLTSKELEKRLNIFRGFFQQIPAMEGETPLLSLRYKAVDNFFREDRISIYLTQLRDRNILNPETFEQDMVNIIAEEFVLTEAEAKREFNKWKQTKEDIVPVEPEYDIYKLKFNPGIDILIYAQHPDYYLHLYRVDSYINLQRILTLLTMMLTFTKTELKIPEKEVKVMEASAEKAIPTMQEVAKTAVPEPLKETVEEVVEDAEDFGDAADLLGAFDDDQVEEEEEALMTAAAASSAAAAAAPPPPPFEVQAQAQAQQVQALPPASKLTFSTANYFINKLKEADSTLFDYAKGLKDVKKYVQICAANETRQPTVLDKSGFERMMLEYKEDIDNNEIDIMIFGYDQKRIVNKAPLPYPTEQLIEDHTFRVLKYGTDVTNQHYYLCSEFFCLRDQILIRKDQFEGTEFRANADAEFVGKTKEPNRCPFCNGKLIEDLSNPKEGETVFRREVKQKSENKKHTFIGFYKRGKPSEHPKGFGLPCCFLKPQKEPHEISPSDREFAPLLEVLKKMGRTEDIEEEQTEKVIITGKESIPNYQNLLWRAYRKYIVGPEKMPLDVGDEPQIGLLPNELNAYFQQTPADLVQRPQIRQEMKSTTEGFFRVAVDNRAGHRQESFFAAIAPFIFLNTADQVRTRLRSVITPKVFVSANYGNLMLEFYDPNIEDPNEKVLKMFSSRSFPNINASNTEEIKRIYKSYKNFLGDSTGLGRPSFLMDKSSIKQYRQFANILAQPGLLTDRGVVFIILDIQPNGQVRVLCPPYGFTELMKQCDVAFLLHQGDIWEPIFYSKNIPETPPNPAEHSATLRFQIAAEAAWPSVVKQRVAEFRKQCEGPDTAIYTGLQTLKAGSILMTLSDAITLFAQYVKGIVRDVYNHIVAVLVSDDTLEDISYIAVPVKDDGLITDIQIFFGWDSFPAASVNTIVKFYKDNAKRFSLYRGYRPEYYIIPSKKQKISAIQLSNGIYIPATAQTEGTIEELGLTAPPSGQPVQLEWEINEEIFKSGDESIAGIEELKKADDIEEIYEHFRLSFSNWFVGREAGAGEVLRKSVENIIFNKLSFLRIDLPLYEKRKRLEVLLGPLKQNWFTMTEEDPQLKLGNILRKDCIGIKVQDECSGVCKWKAVDAEGGEGQGQGRCLIHVPRIRDIQRIFLLRLIEELIRFPAKRQELIQQNKRHVSSLMPLKEPLLIGDTYIIPEDTNQWTDLLRLVCRKEAKAEVPKFAEEFSARPLEQEVQSVIDPTIPLSESARNLLGAEDPKTGAFAMNRWTEEFETSQDTLTAVILYLRTDPDLFQSVTTGQGYFKSNLELMKLSGMIEAGVIQVNATPEDPRYTIMGARYSKSTEFYVLIVEKGIVHFLVQKGKPIRPIQEQQLPDFLQARIKLLPEVQKKKKATI